MYIKVLILTQKIAEWARKVKEDKREKVQKNTRRAREG